MRRGSPIHRDAPPDPSGPAARRARREGFEPATGQVLDAIVEVPAESRRFDLHGAVEGRPVPNVPPRRTRGRRRPLRGPAREAIRTGRTRRRRVCPSRGESEGERGQERGRTATDRWAVSLDDTCREDRPEHGSTRSSRLTTISSWFLPRCAIEEDASTMHAPPVPGRDTTAALCRRDVVGTRAAVVVRAAHARQRPFVQRFPEWTDVEWSPSPGGARLSASRHPSPVTARSRTSTIRSPASPSP